MDIVFSEKKAWDSGRESVIFHARFEKKRVRCVVTNGFLMAPLAGSAPLTEEKALELFETRRSEIDSIIRDRLEKNAIEQNAVGSMPEIVLRSVDWPPRRDMLKRIRVAGWRSIKDQAIDLTPLTVVIGANGAGKSNLLALFKLLNAMFAGTPGFRNYVGLSGFADSLLHYGPRQTPVAEMELTFSTDRGETRYHARWAAAPGGALIFTEERLEFRRGGTSSPLVIRCN